MQLSTDCTDMTLVIVEGPSFAVVHLETAKSQQTAGHSAPTALPALQIFLLWKMSGTSWRLGITTGIN